jgi:hypothetical protein
VIKRVPARRRPLLAPVGCAVLLGAGLAACASSPERRQVALQEDASTCAAFGGRFGSPEYNTCMLAQQRRRDIERIESLERTRLTTEIARNAQLMAERARRERCQRDPERRECGP